MAEIFQIFLQLIILMLLFSFPLNCKKIFKKFYFKQISLYDIILINIIIISNILLFFSFFNINSNFLLASILLFSLVFYFLNLKNYLTTISLFLRENFFIFLIFLITLLSISFYVAFNVKLGWDAIAHWFWKTQVFFQNGSISDFKNIPYSHYPHFGTYIWAVLWKFSILKIEYLGRLYFIFIYIVSLFSIINIINSRYKILFFILIPYLVFDPFALSGYQEIIIFSFTLSIARFLYIIKSKQIENCNLFFLLIILSLNLIIWTKQEGIFISSILAITILICFKRHILDKLKFLLIIIGLSVAYIYLEIYFKGSYGLQENIGTSFLNKYNNIYDFFKTFFFISLNLFIGIIKRPILLLSLLTLIYLTIFNFKNLKDFNFILVFLILNLSFIYSIYFTTSFTLNDYIAPTLGRVLLETSGFYLISLVIFFDFYNQKKSIKIKCL